MQINHQQIKREKFLKLSHEALRNLLSLAENYAKYGSSYIKSEFVWQIYYFQKMMLLYIKKYGPYTFPNNCPKESILNQMIYYKKILIHANDRYLYDAIIDLLYNGKKPKIDFDELFNELDKQSKCKIPIDCFIQKNNNKKKYMPFENKKNLEKEQNEDYYFC